MDLKAVFEYGLAFLTIFTAVFFFIVLLDNRKRLKHFPRPTRFPLVSILIPAYNEEEAIARTIESALNSTYPNKEVIVIDDGSKDGTLGIAKSFEGRGVKVLAQSNKGKGAALNNGLARAKGAIIATLDADSFMEANALEKMVGYLEDPKVGAVTSVMKVHEPRNLLERFQRIEYLMTVYNRRLLSFINAINVTPGPLSVFRKDVFDRVGGYDERNILEDQEIAMRIQAHDYRIESSMDAIVTTNVPRTLADLTKQRVRWQRGGIRNILKHHYLVSPRYGDFGLFIMPLGIFSIFALFAVLLLGLYNLISPSRVSFFTYGFDALVYTISPLHLVSAVIFAATIIWAYLGIKSLEAGGIDYLELLGFILLYSPLITLFWVATAVAEIKREKLRW